MLTRASIMDDLASTEADEVRKFYMKDNPNGNHDIWLEDKYGSAHLMVEYHTEGDCQLIIKSLEIMEALDACLLSEDRKTGEKCVRIAEELLEGSNVQHDVNKTWSLEGNEEEFYRLTVTLDTGREALIGDCLYIDKELAEFIRAIPERLQFLIDKTKKMLTRNQRLCDCFDCGPMP